MPKYDLMFVTTEEKKLVEKNREEQEEKLKEKERLKEKTKMEKQEKKLQKQKKKSKQQPTISLATPVTQNSQRNSLEIKPAPQEDPKIQTRIEQMKKIDEALATVEPTVIQSGEERLQEIMHNETSLPNIVEKVKTLEAHRDDFRHIIPKPVHAKNEKKRNCWAILFCCGKPKEDGTPEEKTSLLHKAAIN